MTTDEFIHEFDVLLNAQQNKIDLISGIPPLLLDEYEKSVFLTQAQEEFVIAAYNGQNQFGYMFDANEESRRYLAPLIREQRNGNIAVATGMGISDWSQLVMPEGDDLNYKQLFVLYEAAVVTSTPVNAALADTFPCADEIDDSHRVPYTEVIPVTLDEFHRVKDNPYRGPSYKRVLRIEPASWDKITPKTYIAELICPYTIRRYYRRYIKKPHPIILKDLSNTNLTINGEYTEHGCELPEITHKKILQRAVQLAIAAKSLNPKQITNSNQTINNNQTSN